MLMARLCKFRSGFTTEEWMELFERQDASGLSQSEFCKRENLSPKTFGNKRRLLGFEGGTRWMEAVAALGFPHDPAVRTEVSPVVAMPSVTVRVGGCEIEVAPGFDAGAAARRVQGAGMSCLRFESKRVFLACGATDMRKSFNGLSAIVEADFDLDPLNGALFVFCNRARTTIKVLEWDGDGFWIYAKSLENTRLR